ncbi:MAG: hypothetical protein ABIQ72_17975 [Usitatibacter sp.]
MSLLLRAVLLSIAIIGTSAHAASDRFYKEKPSSMNGFLADKDPTYLKECGSCHFPYSPGLLPARSWELHLTRLDRHFGETVNLPPASLSAVRKYLTDNAADKSPYDGSIAFMERIKDKTPYRLLDVPTMREMHRIILAVIDRRAKIKVRTLTNCSACHTYADEGSFGIEEMLVPGLSVQRKAEQRPLSR